MSEALKSSRQTVEQVEKLAKMFQAVNDLATDHANLDALERRNHAVTAELNSKREEIGKIDEKLAEVQKLKQQADELIATARKMYADIIEESKLAAAGIKDAAKKDAMAEAQEAKAELVRTGVSLKAENEALRKQIETKRGILEGVDADIEKANQTHGELQTKISQAQGHIANVFGVKLDQGVA